MKRSAQQSSDCEHASELGNAAWRHEAPLHCPVWRRAGDAGHGGFFWFVFFSVKENEHAYQKTIPQIGETSRGPPTEVEGLDQN
jgi:hypothetical protein